MTNGELLRSVVEIATPRLQVITDDDSSTPPAPDKWSPKEVLGHLIDSASNNHGRFVRAQSSDDLLVEGYEQEEWVRAQNYRSAAWLDLVTLWRSYNLHLAHVIEAIPEEQLTQPRHRHNLHQIAWQAVPQDQPVTLDYFIRDYIGHMEHHLGQIIGGYIPLVSLPHV